MVHSYWLVRWQRSSRQWQAAVRRFLQISAWHLLQSVFGHKTVISFIFVSFSLWDVWPLFWSYHIFPTVTHLLSETANLVQCEPNLMLHPHSCDFILKHVIWQSLLTVSFFSVEMDQVILKFYHHFSPCYLHAAVHAVIKIHLFLLSLSRTGTKESYKGKHTQGRTLSQ